MALATAALQHLLLSPSRRSLLRLPARWTRHLSTTAGPPPPGALSFSSRPSVHLPPLRSKIVFDASAIAGRDSGTEVPEEQSEIIFLGTGTSEGIPRVSCLTNQSKTCKVCTKATEPGNKNRRRNTSIIIRYVNALGNFNILVDAGKFFYHSALQWFPAYGLRNIDAVIITHSHADAIGGLDDLRDWTNNVQPCIPIYVAERDFEVQSYNLAIYMWQNVILRFKAILSS